MRCSRIGSLGPASIVLSDDVLMKECGLPSSPDPCYRPLVRWGSKPSNAMASVSPPPPPPPPPPAEVATTEVATSEFASAPQADEIPTSPEGAETAKGATKKKRSGRRGDPGLGQSRELRKREVKSYKGDGVNSEEEEEAEEKPAKKRGRPSKGGITSSASKAFMKVTSKTLVPKAFEIMISAEQLEACKQELLAFPDDAVHHGLTDLQEDDLKSEAAPAAAAAAVVAADADSVAPAAAAEAESALAAAESALDDAPRPPLALVGPSTLCTPPEAVGSLLHVHYFLQSFRELLLPQASDLESPTSLTGLSLNDLDVAIAEGESVVVHDLHCVLLVFLARASKEVPTTLTLPLTLTRNPDP